MDDTDARAADVVVLGSVNLDLSLRVDPLPAPGDTVLAGEPARRPGGKGGNQAVAARQAGAQVAFLGCVGREADGELLTADLAAHGVSTEHMLTVAGASGLAVVLVGPTGENMIAVAPGANHRIRPDDVEARRAVIAGAGVLLTQLETPLDTVARAVHIAAESSTTVVLNLSPAMPVDQGVLDRVDVLVVNRAEAEFVAGRPVSAGADATPGDLAAIAEQIRQHGPRAVVVTAGADGAVCASADGTTHIPAPRVPVVDTTGAGDAFAGALAAGLARGDDLVTAARAATAAGADAVQRPGARRAPQTDTTPEQ